MSNTGCFFGKRHNLFKNIIILFNLQPIDVDIFFLIQFFEVQVTFRVPQGSNLRPILFDTIINDVIAGVNLWQMI